MNAPKLRFAGFGDDWKMTLLSDLMTFNNGINADKDSYGHGRKFINVLDILNNTSIKYKDIIGSVSVSQKVEETNKVEYGDLLFLRSSETREDVGKSSVYLDKDEFALFGGFVIRGKKHGDYHPYFLKLNLELPNVRNQISSKAGGSTRFNVSQPILNSIEINIPCLQEQEKIANFISNFDKKIQLQQEKIDLLKEQKKGYMQKIFSRRLRFKDDTGKDFPQWTKTFLKDIVSKKFKGSNADYSEDPSQGNLLLHNEFLELGINPLYVNKENDVSNKNILILWDGSQAGNIYFNREGVLGSTFMALELIPKINSNFIGQQLQYFEPIIKKSWREGSGVPHVSKSFIDRFKIKICCEEEQQKISDFLNMFDKKIRIEQSMLLELDKQKQAIMQQIFI
ncbi:restriction endonuclease subunit S [Neobacillus mesonae]|uniref:restriction endonuclease subunit S n=1 Tax=Neobacillus mesonae TaxID=1193713 RepID=UPI00203A4580|nr:restriction endonuclease subunit S [Neobacillus mesonae]MCM3567556.1 restriction endonuclease subunit S [Neobacillus mesonae]